MNNDEWGEGGGVGTDGRGGSAGPSSSVCALVVRVRALVVLSVGVRYAWVARRRCLRDARRRPWVGVVGCGLGRVRRRWVVDCSRWGSFAWAGCSWVLVCRSWARW